MSALLIVSAVIGYLAAAMATMRLVAWHEARSGHRGYGPSDTRPADEILCGLAWPVTLACVLALGLLRGIHALATRGVDKRETR